MTLRSEDIKRDDTDKNKNTAMGNTDSFSPKLTALNSHCLSMAGVSQNLTELVSKQQRMKYYQQAKEGRYTKLCRSETAAETEQSKQEERIQALNAIIDRLNQEFPHTQPTLRRATLSLTSRVLQGEESV